MIWWAKRILTSHFEFSLLTGEIEVGHVIVAVEQMGFLKCWKTHQVLISLFVCVGMRWWTLAWLKAQRTPRLSCWRWWDRSHHIKVEGPQGNKTPHSGTKHHLDSPPKPPQPQPHHLCLHSSPQLYPLPPPPPPPSHPPQPLGKHWLKKHVLSPPLVQSTQRCLHEVNIIPLLVFLSVLFVQ